MATARQTYIVEFKVVTQAQRQLLELSNQLTNPIRNAAPLFVHFFNKTSGGFTQFHAMALEAGSALYGIGVAAKMAFGTLLSFFAPVITYYKSAVKEGREFTKAMVLVSAATGTGVGLFEKMAFAVADMGMSAKDAAAGMDTLVRAGLGAKEALSVFPETVKFARAVGVSIDKTATLLVGAINAFRGEGLKAEEFLQTFAFAILKTRYNFETFSTAFAFGGAAASGFGQKLKDTIAVMIKFYDLGIRASTVGTLLRELFTRLSKPTREAQLALLQYGVTMDMVNPRTHSLLEVFKTLGPVAQDMGLATTVFGRRTAGMIGKLVKDVSNYRDFFEKTIQEMNGYTELLTNVLVMRLSTMDGQLDILAARWDTLKVRIYKALEPTAIEQLNVLNNMLRAVEDQVASAAKEITLFSRTSIASFTDVANVLLTIFGPASSALFDVNAAFVRFGKLVTAGAHDLEFLMVNSSKVWYIVRALALSFQEFGKYLGSEWLATAGKSFGILAKHVYEVERQFEGLEKTSKTFWSYLVENSSTLEKVLLAASAAMLVVKPNSEAAQKAVAAYLTKIATGVDVTTLEIKGSISAMYQDFKSITESMAEDAENLFDKMPEKSDASFNKISLSAAKALQDIQKTYSGEGGIGAVVDKLTESAEKFGPEVTDVLRKFASRLTQPFVKGEAQTIIQGYIANLKTIWETESQRQGFFFGITSANARKAILSYELLGENIVSNMVKSSTTAPEKLIAAIIGGTAMTPEQESFIKHKVNSLMAILKTEVDKIGATPIDIDKFLATGEDASSNFSGVANQIRALVLELEGLKGAWNTIEGSMLGTNEALKQLDPELAKLVDTNLKNMQKELGVSNVAFKSFVGEMEMASKAFVTADEKIRELDPAFATRFYEEIARGFKAMDPAAITRSTGLVIDVAGRIKDLTTKSKEFSAAWQVNFIDKLKQAAATMTLPQFQQFLMDEQRLIGITSERTQEAAKFNDILIERYAIEKQLWADSKQAVIEKLASDSVEFENYKRRNELLAEQSTKVRILNQHIRESNEAYNNALAGMSSSGRAIFQAFINGVGQLADALAKRLVDSTFKFRDAVKDALRQIAAEIMKQTVVKGLLGAILKPIMVGIGGEDLFGAVMGNVFGYQRGSSLFGAQGAFGTDMIPAMLSRGEIVLNKSASDAFREMIASGGAGSVSGVNMNVTINAMDGVSVKRVFQRDIVPMINSQLRGNVGISSDVVFRSQSNLRKRPR